MARSVSTSLKPLRTMRSVYIYAATGVRAGTRARARLRARARVQESVRARMRYV